MRAARGISRSRSGFTIVEVLVGVLLVLVAVLIFASAFPTASQARAAAEQNASALAAAQRQVESMRNMPFGSLESGDFAVPELSPGHGHIEVTTLEGDAKLKLVEVSVHWFQSDDPREVSLTTYVAEH